MNMLRRLIPALASLRLTIFALSAALILVFFGTFAQVKNGLYFVQEQYFQSWVIWWSPESGSWSIPVFPGGHCIGAILLINLLCSCIDRFRFSRRKIGFYLTHLGLMVMLVGALVTDLYSVQSFMQLNEGDSKDFSEDPSRMELVMVEETDRGDDQVTVIPSEILATGGTIVTNTLPFKIVVKKWVQNSEIRPLSPGGNPHLPAASNGFGQYHSLLPLPRATRMNERDVMSAVVEIIPTQSTTSLGTWLISDAFTTPQTFEVDQRKWTFVFRPLRYYKPYQLTLKSFKQENYPGTSIPKSFTSQVELLDAPSHDSRLVMISMNHPLRHAGDTYYQSKPSGDHGVVLQVVRNPGWKTPYIACVLMTLGMLIQFLTHLAGFLRRKSSQSLA